MLRQRSSTSPLSDRAQLIVGDSNAKIGEIGDDIDRTNAQYKHGEWPSLNLAFLDPEGLELQWETVAALAEVRTDLISHYSQMGVTRAAPVCAKEGEETVVDLFFGGRDWRGISVSPRSTGRLLEHYVYKLRELEYEEIMRDDKLRATPLIRSTGGRAPLYRLLFASRSPLGHKFWQEVTSKNVYGQQRLF